MKKLRLIFMSISLLLLIDFTSIANAYEWHPYNEHEYSLTENWEPWVTAEQEAVNVGGHLATINDVAENSWLALTFNNAYGENHYGDPAYAGAYIGYYFNDTTWGWTSGEPVTYMNLCPAFPDGGTHGYLHTSVHGWWPESWNAAPWVSEPGADSPLKGIIEHPYITPEPASMLLFGLGGASLGFFRRLKRKKTV